MKEKMLDWFAKHWGDQIWTGKKGYNLFEDYELLSILEIKDISKFIEEHQ